MARTKYRKTNPVHEKIKNLRMANYTYAAIAEIVGLSQNTVQSICQRAGIRCADIPVKDKKDVTEASQCKYCGKMFVNPWNRKGKLFCSDKCRIDYWNEKRRLGEVKRTVKPKSGEIENEKPEEGAELQDQWNCLNYVDGAAT